MSTCLEAQQAAKKAVTLAENSATTAKKAAASASADAKNAQDNASSAKEAADQITFIANGCKGYYSTAQDLRDAYPTAVAGSWAIVAENSTIWVWNPATSAWKDSSVNVDFSDYYKKSEADAKFGTPYSLPAATVSTLGGVKVGDYLDVDEDGTLSGKTLYDTIAASVAVKSEPRLVWNYAGETPNQIKQYSYQIPDNVDYLHITVGANPIYTNDIARGSAVSGKFGSGSAWTTTAAITFHANGTLQFECNSKIVSQGFEFTGYHYPTLAELLAETQAAQADTDALAVDQEYRVALLELGLTDGTTTDTRTT